MCGIAGMAFADPGRRPDCDVLARMVESLRHRGPDGSGAWSGPGAGLGIRRLAIIDPEHGDQPIASEDGSVRIVCNGEIYNHVELRRGLEARGHRFATGSDAEVVVHLYEEHGPACLHRLRGMFGFALWDAPRRQLMLARDRLGIKPLYYAHRDDALYFGSEQKAILQGGPIDRDVDVAALSDLLTLTFVRAPRTMFRHIRALMPAHYLLYREGRVSVQRYWHVAFPPRHAPAERRGEREWAEALRAKLTECVRLHLRSDVPVGAWLSAGLDSSAVTALMAAILQQPIRTFSLGFVQRDHDEFHHQRSLDTYPEYRLSGERAICPADALKHLPQAIWHMECAGLSGIPIARLLMSEASARGVKVVLTGEGADEVLGGYDYFRTEKLLARARLLPAPLRRLALVAPVRRRWGRASRLLAGPAAPGFDWYRTVHVPQPDGHASPVWSDALRPLVAAARQAGDDPWVPEGFESWDRFSQLQYYELTLRLPDLVVSHVDRSSMAHGLEARVPFLDHEFVELCARIPPALKMRGLREKFILRRAVADLLPPEIAWRRKRGLRAPAADWLLGPLPDFAVDLLDETTVRRKGYFDPQVVAGLLARHRSRAIRASAQLMTVLTVHLWDELFRSAPPAGGPPHTGAA